MDELSKDLIFHMGLFMDPKQIRSLTLVDRKFSQALSNPRLWIYFLKRDFNVVYCPERGTPKHIYSGIYAVIKHYKNGIDSCLNMAIELNNKDVITASLYLGADPSLSAFGDAPDSLKVAVGEGHLHILCDLLKLVTLNQEEVNYLFCFGSAKGHIPVIAFLYGYGADDIAGALDEAEAEEQTGVVDYLLNQILLDQAD